MPDWAKEILAIYGPGTFVSIVVVLVVFFLAKAFSQQMSADANKDTTMTGFAVKFDDERRQWQERHDASNRQWQERHEKLQEEFTTFRIGQAEKEGGLKVLQDLLSQERTERRDFERKVLDDNRNLEGRIQELEKHKQASLDRIKELEVERDAKNVIIAEKDVTIKRLEAENAELTNKVEQETNRANSLSDLVERLQTIPVAPAVPATAMATPDVTQPLPHIEEVEETYIPEQTEIKEG